MFTADQHGTTANEKVARVLMHHPDLYVVTNNLNVAAILSDNPKCEVIVAGGVGRNRDDPREVKVA